MTVATPDVSSPGYVITVIATNPAIRVKGRADTRGKIVDRAFDLTDRVLGFEYTDNETEHDTLKLRVDNHDLIFFDSPVWMKGNLIQFIFGYPGRIFGPRFHVIDSMKGFQRLTITAIQESALINKEKCRLFENMTRVEVVKQIFSEGAFIEAKNLAIDESSIATEGKKDWQQSKQSDWQFLRRLAEKIDYELYIEADVLHFHGRILNKEPVKKYEWFFGNGDLLKFHVDEMKAADLAGEVNVAGRDPISRANLGATGSDAETERATLGKQGTLVIAPGKTGRMSASRIIPSPESDQATIKQEADTHFKKSEETEVKATATIIGDPSVHAKQVVEIVGISKLLSGKYYVEKHTHSIGRSGYRGKLKLLKNALTQMPTSDPPDLGDKANENRQTVRVGRRKRITRDPVTGELRQE